MANFTINAQGNIVPYSSTGSQARAGEGTGGATNTPVPTGPGTSTVIDYTPPPSGGGGSAAPSPATPPGASGDFSSMLGIYGLPPDVQNTVNQIFSQTSDVTQATALALAYIRGTDWYAQTYPGIQQGISAGIIGNEADYRAYVNQIDQYTQQYYGTNATSDQIGQYLSQGFNPTHVANLFQGQATVAANTPQWQQEAGQFGQGQMTADQLTAVGNEKSGIDTTLGQKLSTQLDQAFTRMTKAFNGVAAPPGLSLGSQGVNSPGLAGQRQPTAVGAADVGTT